MKFYYSLYLLLTSLLFTSCTRDNNIPLNQEKKQQPDIDIEIPISNTIGVITNEKGIYDGYTLFTPSKSKNTYLINNCGEVLNQWTSNYFSGKSVYLLEDGSILRSGEILNPNIKIGGIGGVIELFDWNNNLIWSYEYSSNQFSHHHDAIPMKNGNILLLIASIKTGTESIAIGRDPETMATNELYNEQIIEIERVGSNDINIVWEWNIWDHLIQDFDNKKANFGIVSENPQLLDINFVGRSGSKADWLHANSIQYNEHLDEIIISFQGTSEFFIIDHSTTTSEAATHIGGNKGKGGDILYRWGNPAAYKLGTKNDRTLFGQHYPHWIPDNYTDGGKILIFNNGLDRPDGDYSTVNIINPLKDSFGNYLFNSGSPYGPISAEWEYKDIGNFFSEIISSAQRLPNGNTIICEGQMGRFFEINEVGQKVWEYINPDSANGILSQGEEGLDIAVFRALKYSKDYPAFQNKDLSAGNPIEINPNIGNCQ
ncbi:aryl-sulfate sulfotransferase [Thalassobellus citreus]|uniref:aryl-sulfate sulfotransferase n=1 Tax=Thalassobellus citreus TaxID=3367752 RepID=UPI0037A8C28B